MIKKKTISFLLPDGKIVRISARGRKKAEKLAAQYKEFFDTLEELKDDDERCEVEVSLQ